MKTFKSTVAFLLFSLVFIVPADAGNDVISQISVDNSVYQEQTVPKKSGFGISHFWDIEAETVRTIFQFDSQFLKTTDKKLNSKGLLLRSDNLSIVQDCKFSNYTYYFFKEYFIQSILFPFHCFW